MSLFSKAKEWGKKVVSKAKSVASGIAGEISQAKESLPNVKELVGKAKGIADKLPPQISSSLQSALGTVESLADKAEGKIGDLRSSFGGNSDF